MTFALPYLIALLACAPKHAPVTPPVMETQPDLELPPLPATVEDESAPPDDPEGVTLPTPVDPPADPPPTTPDPDKPAPPAPGN